MENKEQYFLVWITALTSLYERDIVHGLVVKGYVVSPGSDQPLITIKGGLSSIIALRVDTTKSVDLLYEDVLFVLNKMEAKFFSLIICKHSISCMWAGSNISLPELEEAKKDVDKTLN